VDPRNSSMRIRIWIAHKQMEDKSLAIKFVGQ